MRRCDEKSFTDRYPMEITEFTVSVSLKLTMMCIERLHLRIEVDVVCLSIKLLFLSIHKFAESEKNQSQEKESLTRSVTDRLIEKLGGKIAAQFQHMMDETRNIERDLQV